MMPLRQPAETRADGTLHIHSASIGPGPLARTLVSVTERIKSLLQLKLGDVRPLGEKTWVRLPEQDTQFQIAQRRVHHQALVFEVGGVRVLTRGSVGFDQSMALIAQVPLRDDWIDKTPHLAGLRGYVVQIPIHGTLNQPQVDPRALEQLAADALRQTGSRWFEQELTEGLERWFGQQ